MKLVLGGNVDPRQKSSLSHRALWFLGSWLFGVIAPAVCFWAADQAGIFHGHRVFVNGTALGIVAALSVWLLLPRRMPRLDAFAAGAMITGILLATLFTLLFGLFGLVFLFRGLTAWDQEDMLLGLLGVQPLFTLIILARNASQAHYWILWDGLDRGKALAWVLGLLAVPLLAWGLQLGYWHYQDRSVTSAVSEDLVEFQEGPAGSRYLTWTMEREPLIEAYLEETDDLERTSSDRAQRMAAAYRELFGGDIRVAAREALRKP